MTIERRTDWIILAIAMADQGSLNLPEIGEHLAGLRVICSDEVGASFYRFTASHKRPVSAELTADVATLGAAGLIEAAAPRDGGEPRYGITLAGYQSAIRTSRRVSSLSLRCLRGRVVVAGWAPEAYRRPIPARTVAR